MALAPWRLSCLCIDVVGYCPLCKKTEWNAALKKSEKAQKEKYDKHIIGYFLGGEEQEQDNRQRGEA